MKKYLISRMIALAFTVLLAALAPPAEAQLTHTIPLKVYPTHNNRLAVGDSANTFLEVGVPVQTPSVIKGQTTQVRFEVNGKTYRITNANFRRGDGTTWGANALAAVKAYNTPTSKFEKLPISLTTFAANTYRRIEVRIESGSATIKSGSDAAVATILASTQPIVFEGGLLTNALEVTPATSSVVYVTTTK